MLLALKLLFANVMFTCVLVPPNDPAAILTTSPETYPVPAIATSIETTSGELAVAFTIRPVPEPPVGVMLL